MRGGEGKLGRHRFASMGRKPYLQWRLAILRPSPLWFPDIDKSGQGIIAMASHILQEELVDLAADLVRRRRELIQMRGI